MKRLFSGILALGTLACFSLPASADVVIKDLALSKTGRDGAVRVVITNNDNNVVQEGPIMVTLYARADSNANWKVVKVWNDIVTLQPGVDATRTALSQESPVLKAALAGHKNWEARVVVQAPKNTKLEKTAQFSQGAH